MEVKSIKRGKEQVYKFMNDKNGGVMREKGLGKRKEYYDDVLHFRGDRETEPCCQGRGGVERRGIEGKKLGILWNKLFAKIERDNCKTF